jgi:hypothetical protein
MLRARKLKINKHFLPLSLFGDSVRIQTLDHMITSQVFFQCASVLVDTTNKEMKKYLGASYYSTGWNKFLL